MKKLLINVSSGIHVDQPIFHISYFIHNFLSCGPILTIRSFSESLNSWDDFDLKIGIRTYNRNPDKNRKILIPAFSLITLIANYRHCLVQTVATEASRTPIAVEMASCSQ